MRARRQIGRAARDAGQALVEFAIMAPIIVLLLLYAQWFYEFVQIKLKVQEAARYAAFEFTAHKLHDYATAQDTTSELFGQARASVLADTAARYSDLGHWRTRLDRPRNTTDRTFAAQWQLSTVRASDRNEPRVPGGTLVNLAFSTLASLVGNLRGRTFSDPNPIAEAMIGAAMASTAMFTGAPRDWRLNRKGVVEVTVRARVRPAGIPGSGSLPRRFDDEVVTMSSAEPRILNRTTFSLEEKYAILADHWNLWEGEGVAGAGNAPGRSPNAAHWRQIDRVAWLHPRIKQAAQVYSRPIQTTTMLLATLTMAQPLQIMVPSWDPLGTTLVSRPYVKGAQGAAQGRVTHAEDDGAQAYETAPYLGEYVETLDGRGDYFMGCREQEKLGCTDTLAQDNPFGDYLHRPPQE